MNSQIFVKKFIDRLPSSSSLLQRKCDKCRKNDSREEPARVPHIVHEALRSPSRPLDEGSREFFESRFGHDFGKVRVHTDSLAAKSTKAINALAYTVKQNIVFSEGQYAPERKAGRHLLAHELAHVVQQTGDNTIPQSKLVMGSTYSRLEQEADDIADKIVSSQDRSIPSTGAKPTENFLQRQAAPEEDIEEEYSAESADYEDIDYEETNEEDTEPTEDSDTDLEDGDSPINGTEEIGELSYEQAAEEDLAGEISELDEESFETDEGEVFAKKDNKAAAKTKAKKKKSKPFIKHIDVDLGSQTMKIEWSDGRPPEGGISVSSGKGCPNTKGDPCPSGASKYCTPNVTNRKAGPKGNAGTTNDKGQPMPYYVGVDRKRSIGIHKGEGLGAPHSHGCIRTDMDTARRINQNSNSQTTVTTTGKANTHPWKLGKKETLGGWKGCSLPPEPKKKSKATRRKK